MPLLPLADPSTLDPFDADGVLQVVVETPAQSRNKYTFDTARRILRLGKILPAGMAFPYDFGFVPSTRGGDDDPIDVLLFSDAPTFPGCVVGARLIGVIEAEDTLPSGKIRRNDRLLAVSTRSHEFASVQDVADLPPAQLNQVREFFIAYPRILREKIYTVLGVGGPAQARKLLDEATENFQRQQSATDTTEC